MNAAMRAINRGLRKTRPGTALAETIESELRQAGLLLADESVDQVSEGEGAPANCDEVVEAKVEAGGYVGPGIYRHHGGAEYEVLGIALPQDIIYRPLGGFALDPERLASRPLENFNATVEVADEVEGAEVPRFEFVRHRKGVQFDTAVEWSDREVIFQMGAAGNPDSCTLTFDDASIAYEVLDEDGHREKHYGIALPADTRAEVVELWAKAAPLALMRRSWNALGYDGRCALAEAIERSLFDSGDRGSLRDAIHEVLDPSVVPNQAARSLSEGVRRALEVGIEGNVVRDYVDGVIGERG